MSGTDEPEPAPPTGDQSYGPFDSWEQFFISVLHDLASEHICAPGKREVFVSDVMGVLDEDPPPPDQPAVPPPYAELLDHAAGMLDAMLDWSGAPAVIQQHHARLVEAVRRCEEWGREHGG